MATRNTKPIVIPVSFKTSTLDDKMLLDWLEEKFKTYGKSNYIKLILKEQMIREIKEKE